MAATKAPLLCLVLLLVASAAVADAASCNQWSKLDLCKDALEGKADAVERDCCDQLKEQYGCLCEYTRMPDPDTYFLREITQDIGGIILASCDLEPVSCTKIAVAR